MSRVAGPPPLLVRGVATADGPAGAILVSDGRIAAAGSDADRLAPASARRLEADGLLAAPGFIDLQLNGAAGHDLTADPSSVWAVGAALLRFGVTAFLPTIVSAAAGAVETARRTILAGPPPGYRGAAALGVHAEGPFLNPERRGAHDAAALVPPDRARVADWSPGTGVRLVTLAPELPGALDLVAELVGRGVVVSAGHSSASFEQARAAFDAGVTAVTHLFNAMPPLGHREPGLAGAALVDGRIAVGLIADGVHVHPALVRLAWRSAGAARVVAVTDAIAALGMPPGTYRLGSTDVDVDGRSAQAGGVLAGSVLSLDAAVRNLVAFAGASTLDAIASVTAAPARVLGLGPERGGLRPGGVGDLVLLTPSLEVAATIVGGEVVHATGGLAAAWD